MPHLKHEKAHGWHDGRVVCGVDEAGRGPLAGPVTAAAVILPAGGLPRKVASRIKDSKQMQPQQREEVYEILTGLCRYAVAEATVQEITQLNILWASMLAMRRAIVGLGVAIHMALIDGNRVPPHLEYPATAIVAGDDQSLSIAAASIIAKVTRDRLMKKLAEAHPGYGWEHNFGYPTKEHLEALKLLGATGWHRPSFGPVEQLELDVVLSTEVA